ncbi:mediator of RNA polymerase II transcription subunit 27-like [Littorina saxatilis]|uniref:Mediator of RNA polymerase II transcription subunit 27 n=1 Tax=Littorina saxatilis TaxID=31220 RepID=A0AAN9C1Y0_9CAEN
METESKLKSTLDQIEHINQAIRHTQRLRTHVCQIFRDIGDGLGEAAKSEEEQQAQERQKVLLGSLRSSLETVGHDIGELDKVGQTLVPVSPSANCDHVSLDPILDRTPLYSQVNTSYKRTNKMHEFASLAANILSQNALKRSPHQHPAGGKRVKRHMNTASMVPQAVVDQLVATLDRQHQDMRITVSRPLGSCAVMQMVLGRVLKAQVVLRGLVIEWVKVKGINEEFSTENGKVDIWSKSRYEVFQKISDHAAAAMLHYYAPFMPDIGIRSFTLWLQGYSNLFSAPCHKCGKYLQNAMPPTWRDLRNRDPYHDGCRQ